MKLVSFDVLRTAGFPDTHHLKPRDFFRHQEALREADRVLFPEYWQLGPLQYGLNCRVFPSEATYRIGHDKIEMTRAFEVVAPANTPLTLIEANDETGRHHVWQNMPLPFVAKNPKASMGEAVWLIESRQDWQRYCEQANVLYAQEYLPIDRDLRIVIVGDRIISAYWREQAPQGFYNNLARGGHISTAPLPPQALQLALQVASALGIDHAGFDIAMVDNHPYLLEFNRLFGNRGVDDRLVREAILDYLRRDNTPKRPDGPGDKPGGPMPIAV